MPNLKRSAGYARLWIFALAFGWIEASVVVYLREIYLRDASLRSFDGVQVTLVALPDHLLRLEVVREACTIFLLGAVAWLAGTPGAFHTSGTLCCSASSGRDLRVEADDEAAAYEQAIQSIDELWQRGNRRDLVPVSSDSAISGKSRSP